VQSLPTLPLSNDVEVHVFKPSEGLSTALVFKAMDLSKCSDIVPESLLHCFETDGFVESIIVSIHIATLSLIAVVR